MFLAQWKLNKKKNPTFTRLKKELDNVVKNIVLSLFDLFIFTR